MNIQSLSSKYKVRKITDKDIASVLELFRGNPLYYKHCPPQPTRESISEAMHALPPRTTTDDKFYLGMYNKGELVAVLDLILNFPNAETAFIGFFMLKSDKQGAGEGSSIITEILHCLKNEGYKYTRLGYVKGNPQSSAFWHKNGFSETGAEYDTDGYTVVVMSRDN